MDEKEEIIIYRTCTVCDERKKLTEFYIDRTRKLGRSYICKKCHAKRAKRYRTVQREHCREYARKYNLEHKPEIARQRAKYREDHKEEIDERCKQYRGQHKDQIAERSKQYYAKHKDEVLAHQKIYGQTHREQIHKKGKKWREDHRARSHEHAKKHRQTEKGRLSATLRNHRRRARKLDAKGDGVTPEEFERIIKNQGNKCNICGKRFCKSRPATIDHIIPPLKRRPPHIVKYTSFMSIL